MTHPGISGQRSPASGVQRRPPRVVVIVPAAGAGRRMGRGVDKLGLRVGGVPLLAHTLRRLTASPFVGGVVVVARPGREQAVRRQCRAWNIPRILDVVAGGATRTASVWRGLQAVPARTNLVLVHDGARPFPSAGLIARVVRDARRYGAAIAALPVTATVKEANGAHIVHRTVPRETLWLAQTPQGFRLQRLRRAYQRLVGRAASADAAVRRLALPDDAAVVERAGGRVRLVAGEPENIKVTVPSDLLLAEALWRARRR